MINQIFFCFIVTFLSVITQSAPLVSKTVIKTAPSANLCKSFYYSGLAVLDAQDALVRQVERAHLKRLADFRRMYYHFENYNMSLPPQKQLSISAYKGTAYTEINKFLRTGNSSYVGKDLDRLKQVIADIDRSIDQGPRISKGIVLFRGISSSKNAFGNARAGDVVVDQAFTSTSLSVRTALDFANPLMNPGQAGILQVIHVRRDNLRGLYIEGKTVQSETEVLIDRESKYRVLRTQRVILENKKDVIPISLGDLPITIDDPLLIPNIPPIPPVVIGKPEPHDVQLSLFTPEELPLLSIPGNPNSPMDPTLPIVLPGNPGSGSWGDSGMGIPGNAGPQLTHLIIQHLELIQERN